MDGHLETLDPLDGRRFLIAVRRLADTLSYGTDHSPFLGSGIEFVQSRAYVPGDPIKAIDWKVTARTGRVHVKEFEAPKRLPAYLVIDTSASMTVSSRPLSKYGLALQIAGGIAFACLDRVSPVGVVAAGDRELKVDPSLSRDQILQWLHRLRHFRYDEGTTVGRRLIDLVPRLSHRALLFVFSDFHDPAALPALKLAAQRHDCIAIQFQDPAESGTRGTGFFVAREAETGREFVTRGRRDWLDQGAVEAELRRANIDHLRIRTDRPFEHQLRYFLQARGALGRTAR